MSEGAPTGGTESPVPQAASPERRPSRYGYYFWSALVLLLIIVIGLIEPGIPPRSAWNAIEAEHVHLIASALLRYAQDHQGKFPPGESSTAVFQKLLDEGYAGYFESRSLLFYFPMKGKTPPLEGQPLKPENVSFDVTNLMDVSDSDAVPLVFSTGFKVSYEPGARAQRLTTPDFRIPGFELFRPDPGPRHNSIVVGDKRAKVRTLVVTDDATNPNGSARGFIPADFKSNGKIYRQLTPDGR
jgi:hypothetical protein